MWGSVPWYRWPPSEGTPKIDIGDLCSTLCKGSGEIGDALVPSIDKMFKTRK